MYSEFEALLDRMRFDPDYYEELCEMIRVELFSMGAEAAKERECRQSVIRKLEAKEKRLFELVLVGTVSEELFSEKSREIQIELDDLRNYRADTEYEVKDITATFEYMKRMIVEPRTMWGKACGE